MGLLPDWQKGRLIAWSVRISTVIPALAGFRSRHQFGYSHGGMAGLWTGEVQEHRIGTVTSAVIAEKAATLALSMAPYHYSTANVTKKIKKGEAREYKDGVITQSPNRPTTNARDTYSLRPLQLLWRISTDNCFHHRLLGQQSRRGIVSMTRKLVDSTATTTVVCSSCTSLRYLSLWTQVLEIISS